MDRAHQYGRLMIRKKMLRFMSMCVRLTGSSESKRSRRVSLFGTSMTGGTLHVIVLVVSPSDGRRIARSRTFVWLQVVIRAGASLFLGAADMSDPQPCLPCDLMYFVLCHSPDIFSHTNVRLSVCDFYHGYHQLSLYFC